MLIQVQLVTMVSVPSLRNTNKGARLTKNASLTAVFTWDVAQWGGTGWGLRVVRTGRIKRMRTSRSEDETRVVMCIASTWICTKSFWFLRPTDGFYPLEAWGFRAVEGASGFNRGGEGLAIFTAVEPPSVDKKGLTSVFRITI